jgi:hypothetical protein
MNTNSQTATINRIDAIDTSMRSDNVYYLYSDIDPMTCSLAELDDLLMKASSEWARGYLCGIWSMRQALQQAGLQQ